MQEASVAYLYAEGVEQLRTVHDWERRLRCGTG